MIYVGVDGCRQGWFTVILEDKNHWQVEVFPHISDLWKQFKGAQLILIDIPIGLRDNNFNERHCDKEARALLIPKRKPSVFISPCRAAVYATDYIEAKRINKEKTGRSLSVQTLAIIPKIKQVDQFLTSNSDTRSIIRETHPELCFLVLNNRKSTFFSKKDKKGIHERKRILTSVYPQASEIIDYSLRKFTRKSVAEDDILDALVAAVTASRKESGLQTIPENAEIDSNALPMEILIVK